LHLLSEAVATVGLDYWFLSTTDLNDICNIGTAFKTLTSPYQESHLEEIQRFNPKFVVQEEDFFKKLCSFYMSGIFPGSWDPSVMESAIPMALLQKELTYGENQRIYTRRWLSYLSDENIRYSKAALRKPVDKSERWKRNLIDNIASMLWEKVKKDKLHSFKSQLDPKDVWKKPSSKSIDFAFTNLFTVKTSDLHDQAKWVGGRSNFYYLFSQYARSFRFDTFPPEVRRLFPTLQQSRDFLLIEYLFRNLNRVECQDSAPADLFMLA
jgi:hypothetical protein